MWLLVVREPRPDAPYWSGRRWLAVVDAVVWPVFWMFVFSHVPGPTGIAGPFVVAVALLCALWRLHRALWANHRYRFTTWRWGRVVMALLLIGVVLKLAMTT